MEKIPDTGGKIIFNYEFYSEDGLDHYDIFYMKDIQQPTLYDGSIEMGAISLQYPNTLTMDTKKDAKGRKIGVTNAFTKKNEWSSQMYNLEIKV